MRNDTTDQAGLFSDTPEIWQLILFVLGDNVKTQQVYRRLKKICEENLPGHYRIEVDNILEKPERAYTFDVMATPTVVRNHPKPVRKIIGDLSLTDKVISGLEILLMESSS